MSYLEAPTGNDPLPPSGQEAIPRSRSDPQNKAIRNRNRSVARAYVLAVALAVGGCSGSEIVQNWAPPASAPELAQPNHRRIVADNIKVIFPDQTLLGDVEISGVRPVDHLKGPAWVTCLKVVVRGIPQHYAVFIQDDKVIDSRGGIVIDHCHKETYTPLEIATAAKKPGT